MENLPPPPPHLLHSDDDDPPPPPPPETPSPSVAQRARSVAESVKALQKSGHLPCSPKTLRRAHSMMAGSTRGTPPPTNGGPSTEQIYAPVAHLQQKIQQRQLQQFQHNSHPVQGSEGEQYGFGIQFQQSQSQYYQQMVDLGVPMQSPPDSFGHTSGYGIANHDQVRFY